MHKVNGARSAGLHSFLAWSPLRKFNDHGSNPASWFSLRWRPPTPDSPPDPLASIASWSHHTGDSVADGGRGWLEILGRDRLPMLHHPNERIEEIAGVMGSRTGLRMELNAEDRPGFVSKSSNGAVIQVPMGHLAAGSRQRGLIDAETMVLARDLNPPREFIANRLVGARHRKHHVKHFHMRATKDLFAYQC